MDGLQKISSGADPNRVADEVFVFPSPLARGDRFRKRFPSHSGDAPHRTTRPSPITTMPRAASTVRTAPKAFSRSPATTVTS